MIQNEDKLKQIYGLMLSKLKELQINNKFDKALRKEEKLTYINKPDNYFFQRMCDLVFQSGVRGSVWQKYEPVIKKEFADYKVKKVVNYTEKDVDRIMANQKMFQNRLKIQACIHNAKKIAEISEEYGGFWRFLNTQPIEKLIEDLTTKFRHFRLTNTYAFLRYCGMDVMKPDLNVRRVCFRLGLTPSFSISKKKEREETIQGIQDIGKKMSQVTGQRVVVIDYLIYMFGSGEKEYVRYAICSKVSKCNECPLKKFCSLHRAHPL